MLSERPPLIARDASDADQENWHCQPLEVSEPVVTNDRPRQRLEIENHLLLRPFTRSQDLVGRTSWGLERDTRPLVKRASRVQTPLWSIIAFNSFRATQLDRNLHKESLLRF